MRAQVAAVQVSGLRKSYGQVQAVRDVGFSLRKGEILGFAVAFVSDLGARRKPR